MTNDNEVWNILEMVRLIKHISSDRFNLNIPKTKSKCFKFIFSCKMCNIPLLKMIISHDISQIDVFLKVKCIHLNIHENADVSSIYPFIMFSDECVDLTFNKKIGKILIRNNVENQELRELLYNRVYSQTTLKKYYQEDRFGKGLLGFIDSLKERATINRTAVVH